MKKVILLSFLSFIITNSYSQCNVKKTIDKFENKESYHIGLVDKIGFGKFIKNGREDIFLFLRSSGPSTHNGKGVYILLKDGSKIIRESADLRIGLNSNRLFGGFDYSYLSFIVLDDSEIAQLLKSPITDFKLYIYEDSIKSDIQNSDLALKCIREAK